MSLLKRPSNRPRAEIERMARQAIETHGGGDVARVWYKFDCGGCGTRCRAPQANVLPERGTCDVCGAETKVIGAGYALEVRGSRFIDWDNPEKKVLVVRKQYESDRGDA